MVEPIGPVQPSVPPEPMTGDTRMIAKDLDTQLTKFIQMLNGLNESSAKDPNQVIAFGSGIESLHESAKAAVGNCPDCLR